MSNKMTAIFSVFLCISLMVSCKPREHYSSYKMPSEHVPVNSITLKSLENYVVAYCWQDKNARQSAYHPEEKEIQVVVTYVDGSKATILGGYRPQNQGYVYMLGCFARETNGIRREGNEITWRPNSDLLTMVYGIDPQLTNFKFFSITNDLVAKDIGEPINEAEYATSFTNPRGVLWSPDGTKFVTLAQDAESGAGFNIWTYDTNINKIAKVTNVQRVGNFIANAAWSDSGKEIAIGYGVPYSGIRLMSVENPDKAVTVSSETHSNLQDWPYVLDNPLEMLSMDSTITFNYYITKISVPVWYQNDRKVVFVAANNERRATLFIVNADGSNLQELLPGFPGILGLPKLAPDGSTLAFIRYPDWKNRDRVEIALIDLETMEYFSLAVLPKPRNGDQLFISGMDWTSDSKYLAFSSPHDGESDIYVISRDGSAWVNLTETVDGDAVNPIFRP